MTTFTETDLKKVLKKTRRGYFLPLKLKDGTLLSCQNHLPNHYGTPGCSFEVLAENVGTESHEVPEWGPSDHGIYVFKSHEEVADLIAKRGGLAA